MLDGISMWALVVATIYFGSFLLIGMTAKLLVDRWMGRRGVDLSDIQADAGPNRRERQVFLLGVWRTED
jgi:hypothetical protein